MKIYDISSLVKSCYWF